MTTPARYTLIARLNGFTGDYQRASRLASEGLSHWADSPHLLRHRGEFRIVLRDFHGAREDLERAVEVCEDKADEIEYYRGDVMRQVEALLVDGSVSEPEPAPLVTSENLEALAGTYKASLKSSAWYHLALASYLLRDFARAATDFKTAFEAAIDYDMRVAATDWAYMSSRRLGDDAAAQAALASLPAEPVVHAPNYLRRVSLYRGHLMPADLVPWDANPRTRATLGYGLGNWLLCNGDVQGAKRVFQEMLERSDDTAFGYIAAELDLNGIDTPSSTVTA